MSFSNPSHLWVKSADPAAAPPCASLLIFRSTSRLTALGLGLDELDIEERVGRDALEADVALGVDQERAVQRLALEIVVGLVALEQLETWDRPGSASGT